jgi:hypothetical protein
LEAHTVKTIMNELQRLQNELTRMKQQSSSSHNFDSEDGKTRQLSARYPEITVLKEALSNKMAARTPLAKVKGVYDLLMPRSRQAEFSGRGRGDIKAVPDDIFGALQDYFQPKYGPNAARLIVEAINEKGAQARLDVKRKRNANRASSVTSSHSEKPEESQQFDDANNDSD